MILPRYRITPYETGFAGQSRPGFAITYCGVPVQFISYDPDEECAKGEALREATIDCATFNRVRP